MKTVATCSRLFYAIPMIQVNGVNILASSNSEDRSSKPISCQNQLAMIFPNMMIPWFRSNPMAVLAPFDTAFNID